MAVLILEVDLGRQEDMNLWEYGIQGRKTSFPKAWRQEMMGVHGQC